MRIRTGVSGSLLVLLTLTGCGSDEPDMESKDSSSAPSDDRGEGAIVDVCTLLSAADLDATFGSSFDEGELIHHEETGADQCLWTSTDTPSPEIFSVTVLRQDGLEGTLETSGMSLADLFERAKMAYPNAEDVDLGDEAYAAVSEVQVLAGDTWYSFTAYLGAGGDPLDELEELAAQVVA